MWLKIAISQRLPLALPYLNSLICLFEVLCTVIDLIDVLTFDAFSNEEFMLDIKRLVAATGGMFLKEGSRLLIWLVLLKKPIYDAQLFFYPLLASILGYYNTKDMLSLNIHPVPNRYRPISTVLIHK